MKITLAQRSAGGCRTGRRARLLAAEDRARRGLPPRPGDNELLERARLPRNPLPPSPPRPLVPGSRPHVLLDMLRRGPVDARAAAAALGLSTLRLRLLVDYLRRGGYRVDALGGGLYRAQP